MYVPPGAVAVSVAEELGHNVGFATVGANGVGLTVIEKLAGLPTHEFAVGVTEITPTIGDAVPFVDTKEGGFPKPDVANPIAGFEFVQFKLEPAKLVVNVDIGTVAPAQ